MEAFVHHRRITIGFMMALFALSLVACTSVPAQTVDDFDVPMTLAPAQTVDDFDVPMILVPAGEFLMVSQSSPLDDPVEKVVFVDDFYIDVYEVTNRRYRDCVQDGVCDLPDKTTPYDDPAYLDHPVVFVTVAMAETYCEWRGVRLPNKAEWDKAAAEELETWNNYWGSESPVCQIGAPMGASIDDRLDFNTGTEATGSHDPNSYGLYDMTGNVWEWVQDRYEGDQTSDEPGDSIVSFLRMTRWSGYGPLYGRFLCGFRCASSP